MLGFTICFQTSVVFGFIASDWYVPVSLMLLVAVGIYGFVRFRGLLTSQGSPKTPQKAEAPKASQSTEKQTRQKAETRPPKTTLARSASSETQNFSKNYAASLEINHLPIGTISAIAAPRPVEELPDSDDDGLLAAIDEVQDDSDSDSEFRLIALRVLAGFRNRNSIEALSQIALYDLSSNMRSKAVMMLADFDHESVFETVVLACADPSREVRAAAARALVKVSFDRGDAWTRIAFSEDQYMGRQIARAAVEGGIAERSFDRLVMQDEKAVYESFALVYLLIRTGETEKIFNAIRNHRDIKTKVALLHTVRVANVAEVIPELSAFIAAEPMGSVVADKARETLLGINAVPVGA